MLVCVCVCVCVCACACVCVCVCVCVWECTKALGTVMAVVLLCDENYAVEENKIELLQIEVCLSIDVLDCEIPPRFLAVSCGEIINVRVCINN